MSQYKDYEGYEFTSDGRCYSHFTKKFMSPWKGTTGYMYYKLSAYKANVKIHKVLMGLFGPEKPFDDSIINHLDGDKTNYALSNLEWSTFSNNLEHAWRSGLRKGIWNDVMLYRHGKATIYANLNMALRECGLTDSDRISFIANGVLSQGYLAKSVSDETSWEDVRNGRRGTYVREKEATFELYNVETKEVVCLPTRSKIRRFLKCDKNALQKRLDHRTGYPLNGWSIREAGDTSVKFKAWSEEELWSHSLRGNIRPYWVTDPEGNKTLYRSITAVKEDIFQDLTGTAALQRAVVKTGTYRNHTFTPLEVVRLCGDA